MLLSMTGSAHAWAWKIQLLTTRRRNSQFLLVYLACVSAGALASVSPWGNYRPKYKVSSLYRPDIQGCAIQCKEAGKMLIESFRCRCWCQHLPGAVVIHLQDASVTVNTCWSGGSEWKRSCVFIACLCGLILIADWTMVTTIRLQQLAALAESDGWGDTHGSDEHLTWPHRWFYRCVFVCGGTTSVLSTAVHLQSWCACRLAGPWPFSSGSPAGTLPDLPAAAALCQRGTDETMWGRTHKQHLWFINRLCYY